jgi:hypothetical protein
VVKYNHVLVAQLDRALDCGSKGRGFESRQAHFFKHMEGSHSGQLHEFRKLEGAIPSQVQILYPPPLLADASYGGQNPQYLACVGE